MTISRSRNRVRRVSTRRSWSLEALEDRVVQSRGIAGLTALPAQVMAMPAAAGLGAHLFAAHHPFTGVVASFDGNPQTLRAGHYAAIISWGDGTHPTFGRFAVDPAPDVHNLAVLGRHSFRRAGDHMVHVTITHFGLPVFSMTSMVSVGMTAPTAAAPAVAPTAATPPAAVAPNATTPPAAAAPTTFVASVDSTYVSGPLFTETPIFSPITPAPGPNPITPAPGPKLPDGGFDIYPLPGSYPGSKPSIIAGPGYGNWFVDGSGDLGMVARDGTISFPVKSSATSGGVGGVTMTPDATIYYTQGSSVGFIRPGASAPLTPIPNGLNAYAVTTDPRGDLWFVQDSSVVGESRTDGTFVSITLPGGGPTNFAPEESIVTGLDGNIWVSRLMSVDGNTIDRINPDGKVTEFVLSHGFDTRIGLAGALDVERLSGPDGNVWFADYGASQVGKITPDGTITRYDVGGRPNSITAGPDGAFWFTLNVYDHSASGFPGVIGRITTDGTVTGEYAPDAGLDSGALDGPDGITTGADGALWFTVDAGDAVGRLVPSVAGSPSATSSLRLSMPYVSFNKPFDDVIAHFIGSVQDFGAGLYSATIDWGDGTPTTAGTIGLKPNGEGRNLAVSGTHTYTTQGNYSFSVTIMRGEQVVLFSHNGFVPLGV